MTHPTIVLVLGDRGSGKTALQLRLLELLSPIARPYLVAIPAAAAKDFPDTYGIADDPDALPNGAVVAFPEAYRLFSARETQTTRGRALAEIVNLSRQRDWTLIFDVQNSAHLDPVIIGAAGAILIKEPAPFSEGFERKQLKPYLDAARAVFASIPVAQRKRSVWVVAPRAGIPGRLMHNELPSFWRPQLSKMFAEGGTSPSVSAATPRAAAKMSKAEKQRRARAMRAAGHSFGQIGKTLGIDKSYAWRLCADR
ncbi:MAG: hypothetical protein HY678_02905 [Chloroflexi bacterium]|nr:hypothetical protein [Chloroflexota bacterium]